MESITVTEELVLPVIANRFFVFDMDGTLLIKTTACLEIARISGTLDQLHILEKQFASGEIDAFCFAQDIGALWGSIGASRFPLTADDELKREHILNPKDKAVIVQRWWTQR
jgi:hypothetical protein